ncbi:MAG: hypothetical protein RLZZ385_2753 [Pseudomonadota bacterium]
MPNPQLLFAAQLVSMLSVILLAIGYLKAEPKASSARTFALMVVFVVFYLLNGMTASHIDANFRLDIRGLDFFFTVGSTAIPGLFMVYCFLVFQEQRTFPRILAGLFAVQLCLESIFFLFGLDAVANGSGGLAALVGLVSLSTDIMQLGFAGAAVYWTLKGWRSDLVEDRRAWRWMVISVQGGLIFMVALLENFLLPLGSVNDAQAQAAIVYTIAILALGMVVVTMQFDYLSLSNVIRKVVELREEPEPEESAKFDINRFNHSFRDAKLYREAGLTIASLAGKLGVPEYRLRAFIHKTLGFRNFNAMLHKYRIEDACQALADPKNASVPVLTIALTVGYQSITPFNNAFREIMGMTPSEYRKKSHNGG